MVKILEITKSNVKSSSFPLVIGYFGCIHVMHGQLLNKCKPFNVLTFKDTPLKTKSQIYSYKQRIDNIVKFKPNNIFVFDISKYNYTAQQFIDKILLKINPSEILVGSDFKFGSDNKNFNILKTNFNVNTLNYNPNVSTTKIKKLLIDKKIEKANDLMYFPYYYTSEWIFGQSIGRKIGTRTINLKVNSNFILPEGSYVTITTIGHKKYKSITFFGKSKTYNVGQPTLETHIINKFILPRICYLPIIKRNITIEFFKYIRSNTKFNKIESLVKAIEQDIKVAKEYFVHHK